MSYEFIIMVEHDEVVNNLAKEPRTIERDLAIATHLSESDMGFRDGEVSSDTLQALQGYKSTIEVPNTGVYTLVEDYQGGFSLYAEVPA